MFRNLWFALLLFTVPFGLYGKQEKKQYPLTNDPIDVVIVSHEKDQPTIDFCIEGIKKNGENIGNVYVVSAKPLTKKAVWIDEAKFPFSKKDIAFQIGRENQKTADKFFSSGHNVGWYYQQLLKLYSSYMIPNISPNVLIIDADSVFLNRVSFLNKKNGGLFCINDAKKTRPRYVRYAARLLPNYKHIKPEFNSVHHHMLFQKAILDDLFRTVQNYHKMPFWKAFCRAVDLREKGASEYEVYYNFALSHSSQVGTRFIKRRSSSKISEMKTYQKQGYQLVSFHSYMRK